MAELVVTPDDNTKNGATERVESAAASAETNEQRVELGVLTGQRFLDELVRQLSLSVPALGVYVSYLETRREQFRTVAFWFRDRLLPPFRYDCEGAPCSEVLRRDQLCHFHSVQEAFPDDAFLRDHAIRSLLASPVRDRNGVSVGLIGLLHDDEIAVDRAKPALERWLNRVGSELERIRTQRELRHAKERFDFLTDHVPGLLWTADRDGRLTFVSGHELTRAGVDSNEILGTRAGNGAHDAIWGNSASEGFRRAIEGETLSYRERWREEWYEVSIGPIREADGQVIGVIGAALNRTERVDEEARRAAERERVKAQERWESLSLMAGQIAHDFNNLLMGVMGNAGVALMRIPDGHSARECVEQIEKASSRAAELTQQLMVCAGAPSTATRSLPLRSLVESCIARVRQRFVGNYQIAVEVPPELAIDVDPSQTETLISNLIVNAIQATEGRGRVVVKASRATLGATRIDEMLFANDCRSGGFVRLSVCDTGTGIPEALRRRVFEPFYTTRSGSRGLGLAAVLGIARGHRAAIDVRDGDPGTIVDVYFAAESVEDETAEAVAVQESQALRRPLILVVDDEEMVRAVAQLLLEGVGFSVETASGGAEALERLRRDDRRVDVVLLDLTMPDLDGRETFLAMREAGFETPVVLTSGYLESEVWSRFRADGVAGFIQKPYRVDDLVAVLRQALGGV